MLIEKILCKVGLKRYSLHLLSLSFQQNNVISADKLLLVQYQRSHMFCCDLKFSEDLIWAKKENCNINENMDMDQVCSQFAFAVYAQ